MNIMPAGATSGRSPLRQGSTQVGAVPLSSRTAAAAGQWAASLGSRQCDWELEVRGGVVSWS
jgi:hypothetical protein